MIFLLKHEVLVALERALDAGLKVTDEERARYVAGRISASASGPSALTIAGDVAEIRVEGIMTEKPDFLLWLFGGGNCTYEDIRSALAIADNDPNVKRLEWDFRTPGGELFGLFETLASIEGFSKPQSVRASEACSAAYAMAALAGKIRATSEAAAFGSVGVAASFRFSTNEEVVYVTSTEAPDKRPDPRTEEGKSVIRRQLDAVHSLFVDAIARGRSVDVDLVNANYGRGATVLAGQAKKLGMIDSIVKPVVRGSGITASADPVVDGAPQQKPMTTAASAATTETTTMDVKQLKDQHNATYEAAVAVGVDQERKRVKAHLVMGEKCGALPVALAAIKDGTEFGDPVCQAEYLSAPVNKAALEAAQKDSDTAAAATGGVGGAQPPDVQDAAIDAYLKTAR